MSIPAARLRGSALGCLLAVSVATAGAEAQTGPEEVQTPAAAEPAPEASPTPEAPQAPETSPTPEAAPAAEPASESEGEQIILDPELADIAPPVSTPTATTAPVAAPAEAQVRAVLHSRFGGDFRREDPREEIWESTTLATLDASIRRSERLRFSLGMRARYRFATLEDDVPDASAAQHLLDAVPTAGYADLSLGSGVHLRIGYQPLHLGRFDIFSATNFLSVSDLRDGPSTMPEGAEEIGQLALLVDYDVAGWLSLRAIYVPFFVPHVVSLTESDYAIFPATQAATDDAIDAAAGPMMGASRRMRTLLRSYLSRSDRARLAQTGFAAFAPDPTFMRPQGALRATAHGPAGEVAFTIGSALEHLPSFELSQSFVDYAFDMSTNNELYLAAASRPIEIRHDRFFVVSVDGTTDVGPVSLGAELAYMNGRTLYALRKRGTDEGLPNPTAADLAHLGLRAEYTASDEWLAAIEAFGDYALTAPRDGACKKPRNLVDESTSFSECTYMFLDGGRFLTGAAAMASFSPAALGLHFELSSAIATGPSFVLLPRIGYEPWDEVQLELEIGALLVEGKQASGSTPSVALGAAFDAVDLAFVGVRYQP